MIQINNHRTINLKKEQQTNKHMNEIIPIMWYNK